MSTDDFVKKPPEQIMAEAMQVGSSPLAKEIGESLDEILGGLSGFLAGDLVCLLSPDVPAEVKQVGLPTFVRDIKLLRRFATELGYFKDLDGTRELFASWKRQLQAINDEENRFLAAFHEEKQNQ